jgi:hypothetical protein
MATAEVLGAGAVDVDVVVALGSVAGAYLEVVEVHSQASNRLFRMQSRGLLASHLRVLECEQSHSVRDRRRPCHFLSFVPISAMCTTISASLFADAAW